MDRHRLTPSLVIEPAQGHTLGHAMLHLHSRSEDALFSGDCFHHPLQLTDPELQFGPAEDLSQAVETRRKLVTRGLQSDALIIPAHLPAPHAGRVRTKDEGGVLFEALK
jgi:glyoxylase-like metal-dependent hydrolase (beta-lactamase superfamily II)